MRCPRCRERLEDGGHWCIPYANWVAQGMFDFVRGTIDSREGYRRSGKAPEAAVAGFSSCLVMSVAMVAEVSLKTLLARKSQCAVKGAFSQWVRLPPGNCRSSR